MGSGALRGANATFWKNLLFFINLAMWMLGGAMIGLGIYVAVSMDTFGALTRNNVIIAGSVFAGIGFFVFVMAFFGCCGAVRESARMLNIFFYIVLVLFLAEIAVIALVVIYQSKLMEKAETMWHDATYGTDADDLSAINQVQATLDCCGWNNASDWQQNPNNAYGGTWPSSCCIDEFVGCNDTLSSLFNPSNVEARGCKQAIESFLKENLLIVCIVGGVVIVMQIGGMVLANWLVHRILEEHPSGRGRKFRKTLPRLRRRPNDRRQERRSDSEVIELEALPRTGQRAAQQSSNVAVSESIVPV